MDTQVSTSRLAILIDAENASANLIDSLLEEVPKYGTANVKRIYGDWTSTHLNGWKDKLNKFAIQPIQQFRYTTGKNSTDSALIIDAMDLLYTNKFDGFCLISSDSDFTRLACRIREAGLTVYGFGEKQKTPEAFAAACNKFIYTNIFEQSAQTDSKNGVAQNAKLIKLLKGAYKASTDKDEWICLSFFASQLNKLSPDFAPKNYGYKKLNELVKNVGIFDLKSSKNLISIKLKENIK